MSLLAIRFMFWVGVGVAAMGLLYWTYDKIGDAREAQVVARYDRVIDSANDDTDAANDAATKVRIRVERERTEAVSAFKATLGKPETQCLLKEAEAETLARVR